MPRLAKEVASWFSSWGNDVWPHVAKCERCGDVFSKTKSEYEYFPSNHCFACKFATESLPCLRCGVQIPKEHKHHKSGCCDSCKLVAKKKSRRESKKKYRDKHGQHANPRKRCRKYGVPYTPISRKAVYDRDNWECQLCGKCLLRKYTRIDGVVDPLSPTVDHIIPLSLGPGVSPGHVWGNVQAACWECNTRKGADPDFKGD